MESDLPHSTPRGGTPRSLRSRWRNFVKRLMEIHGEPKDVAAGFALGVFFSSWPALGLQTFAVLPIAAGFRWNKIAAVLGVWVNNPLTAPLFYGLTWLIGSETLTLFTGHSPTERMDFSDGWHMLKSAPEVLPPLLVGGILLGIPAAVIAYYLVYVAILEYRKHVKQPMADTYRQLRQARNARKALRKRKSHSARKTRGGQ